MDVFTQAVLSSESKTVLPVAIFSMSLYLLIYIYTYKYTIYLYLLSFKDTGTFKSFLGTMVQLEWQGPNIHGKEWFWGMALGWLENGFWGFHRNLYLQIQTQFPKADPLARNDLLHACMTYLCDRTWTRAHHCPSKLDRKQG